MKIIQTKISGHFDLRDTAHSLELSLKIFFFAFIHIIYSDQRELILDVEQNSAGLIKTRLKALQGIIFSQLQLEISERTVKMWRKEILKGNETYWKHGKTLQNHNLSK